MTQSRTETEQKYYGKYRGFVKNNEDPEQRGRLRVTVPSILGDEILAWALPCFSFGGLADQGFFAVPKVDAQVWVEFEEGDLDRPIWTGTFWQTKEDVPEEAARQEPTARLLKTPGGHLLLFDDEADKEKVVIRHHAGSEIHIDPKGIITLKDSGENTVILDPDKGEITLHDKNGNQVSLQSAGITLEDANSNKIEMAASGVTVKGKKLVLSGTQVMLGGEGGEPVIKGQSFLSLFASHIHTAPPGTAGGPTTPPIPQGEMSTLSTKVTTS